MTDESNVEVSNNGTPAETPVATVEVSAAKESRKKSPKKRHSTKPVAADPSFFVPVTDIVENRNPRNEPEQLFALGYSLIGKHPTWQPTNGELPHQSLVEMALSDDLETVQEFVSLIETHENVRKPIKGEKPRYDGSPQSIVELAEEIQVLGQLLGVFVKKTPKGYVLLDGARRLAAILYNYAKARVNGKRPAPPTIKATETSLNAKNLTLASIILNLGRKQFTPLQEGLIYHKLLKTPNPRTGKKYTLEQVSDLVKVPKGTCRNREALWRDFDPKTGRGLTDNDRRRLSEGNMTLTAATRKALGERHYSTTGEPKKNRAKPRSIGELRERFDNTAERESRIREVLAWAMGLTLPQATKESEHRISNEEMASVNRRPHKTKAKG